jgi:hypothetical protein
MQLPIVTLTACDGVTSAAQAAEAKAVIDDAAITRSKERVRCPFDHNRGPRRVPVRDGNCDAVMVDATQCFPSRRAYARFPAAMTLHP